MSRIGFVCKYTYVKMELEREIRLFHIDKYVTCILSDCQRVCKYMYLDGSGEGSINPTYEFIITY